MTRKEQIEQAAIAIAKKHDYPWDTGSIAKGFRLGAEWADKTFLLEKACEWLKGFMECSPLFEYQVTREEMSETINDFRKAMVEE